jgi:hypothetical protein
MASSSRLPRRQVSTYAAKALQESSQPTFAALLVIPFLITTTKKDQLTSSETAPSASSFVYGVISFCWHISDFVRC